MKNAKSFLLAAILGSIAAMSPVLAADYVVSKEEVAPGSYYCHMKLPAVQARSLPTDNPIPKDASSGDIIDYYGPCDENAFEQNGWNGSGWISITIG